MTPLRFEVISEPVAKARARVALRGGRVHAYTPTKTANAEWRIRTAFLEAFPYQKALIGPVELIVVAYVPMPASMPKKRRINAMPVTRPDADNYLKTVLDALNRVAFQDDSQVVTLTCSKRYASDGRPAWAITITPLTSQPAITPDIPAQEATPLATDDRNSTQPRRSHNPRAGLR